MSKYLKIKIRILLKNRQKSWKEKNFLKYKLIHKK